MGSPAAGRRTAERLRKVRHETDPFRIRRSFACFTEEDARLLVELRPVFERHVDALVDRFHEHLLRLPNLQPFLADPETVQRLRRFQRDYLLSLVSGRYDEAYVRDRHQIGRTHERIGLDPQWFLGAHGLYIELLMPRIHEHFRAQPAKAVRAGTALNKLLILDMQLVLDVYYETRQRKAVERSEQLAAVGELAASIAHEVRNPLAGMKGALQVLRGELAVKRSNAEIVDELLAQIVRLEQLVRDLLTFARPRVVSCQPFDLQELLDRLLRQYKETTDKAGITIQRVYGPGTGEVVADLQQMEQVFINLIQNSIQAMERGGSLTVTTSGENNSIAVTFADTGKGIPPSELGRIFQPFFTTKHRGSGLGLPIVKKILEAHDGTIEVSTEPGSGTTATVRIPGRQVS
jgi:signal transduction histidine kinase